MAPEFPPFPFVFVAEEYPPLANCNTKGAPPAAPAPVAPVAPIPPFAQFATVFVGVVPDIPADPPVAPEALPPAPATTIIAVPVAPEISKTPLTKSRLPLTLIVPDPVIVKLLK
ncbi:MAG: hypothetical protein EBU90_14575 [Proteobacteria bacterium]|nr:hypothetical protein [Pseudomonadota bacterium]